MLNHDLTTSRRRKPWAITFFGLLAAGGLIAMPFLAGAPDGEKMPDLVRFLGHFHPVLLHLPIGVFVLILFQELGAIFSKRGKEAGETPLFPLFFGAASAIVAVLAGFLLYHGEVQFRGSELAERHLWGGLIFAVAAVVTLILKAWTMALNGNAASYRLLLFVSVGVMGFASHDGASITHGEDYLTEYAPEPIQKLLGAEPEKVVPAVAPAVAPAGAAGEQSVYANIVAPILERRCVQCHKEGKAKGKFRMDTYEFLVAGGKEGPGLQAGNSAESNILIRMNLPTDDEEHMPPEGKPDIEDPEVAVITWWIDNGADPKKSLTEFDVPASIREAIAKVASIAPAQVKESAAPAHAAGPDEALKSSVVGISKQFPGALSFESQQSALLTFTAVSMRGNFDDAGFKTLAPVLPHLVTVDLSATKITDQAVSQLSSAKNLRLVRLAETGVTDASIDTLLTIPSLESINLYGTKVTDTGVNKLSAMPNLKRLYLWQTAVTPAAIKALKEKLPSCEITTGA